MHIYFALAVLAHAQSVLFVAGVRVAAASIPSVVPAAGTASQRSPDQALALIFSPFNGTSSALRRPSNVRPPSTQSNTTLVTAHDPIPYRVEGTPTTLLFHSFGDEIPAAFFLQCLGFSITVILEITLEGRGRDELKNGLFQHAHLMPNGDNVTITVADFREIGKPMTYDDLRDVLSGIGDFVTEPRRAMTTLSYEVDVDGKGYVGTGHVGYDIAAMSE